MLPGLPVCSAPVKGVIRHHEEAKRAEQKIRLTAALKGKSRPLVDLEIAAEVRKQMRAKRDEAETEEARRSYLPSLRCVQAILGLFRFAATLKRESSRGEGWGRPLYDLELGAGDIGELIEWSRSTVFAALRWMGDVLHSSPRYGLATLTREDDTQETFPMKRTSVRCLSAEGMAKLEVSDPVRFMMMVQRKIEMVQLQRDAARMEADFRQGSLFRPTSTHEEDREAAALGLAFAEAHMQPAELAAYKAARAQRMRGS